MVLAVIRSNGVVVGRPDSPGHVIHRRVVGHHSRRVVALQLSNLPLVMEEKWNGKVKA